jgi:hypothetical protein
MPRLRGRSGTHAGYIEQHARFQCLHVKPVLHQIADADVMPEKKGRQLAHSGGREGFQHTPTLGRSGMLAFSLPRLTQQIVIAQL